MFRRIPYTPSHSSISLLLLLGLLILRIPFLVTFAMIYTQTPGWVYATFAVGTYSLTAILIWWERDRLQEFWFDLSSAIVFLCQNMIFPVGIGLFVAMWRSKSKFPIPTLSVLRWGLIGALMAIMTEVFILQPLMPQSGVRADQMSASLGYLFVLIFVQMTNAAVFEEPLFRGFLWGMLRRAHLKDGWIWVMQAVLFTLAHVYYLRTESFGPWFIRMFIPSLLLGLIAWRAKSITASMITHGVLNASGDVLAHFGTLESSQSIVWMAAALFAVALVGVWVVETIIHRKKNHIVV